MRDTNPRTASWASAGEFWWKSKWRVLNKRFNSVYRLLYGFVASKVSDIDVWYVDEYINRIRNGRSGGCFSEELLPFIDLPAYDEQMTLPSLRYVHLQHFVLFPQSTMPVKT